MRITDEKINAYGATLEIEPSRYEYLGGGSGFGSSYYLFILPKTTLSRVSLIAGFTNDENSIISVDFQEFVNFNGYSFANALQSTYTEVSKIAVNNKSKIDFSTASALNTFTAIYFTDSRDNKYIIVRGTIRTQSNYVLLLASCTTSNAIIADSWFLLKNGETQDLICNTPLLIKPNYPQSIAIGTRYTIQKPGIVYYVNSAAQPKIMIVNPGDELTAGGYLYYLLEIA